MIEYKSYPFEIKADVDSGIFEGYASVFGNIDSYRDIVMPGAFTKTINENKNRVKVLWQHDQHEPIGKPIFMQEDTKGLYVKAQISKTDVGLKALTLMKDGVINELSIGYDTVKEDYDNVKRVRMLKELRLWEFSAVTFAANDAATIDRVKQELKVGRMISGTNRGKIQTVIDALMALLQDDEPQEPEEIDGCTPNHEKSLGSIGELDPNHIQSILAELKKYK